MPDVHTMESVELVGDVLKTAHFDLADFEQNYPIDNITPENFNDTDAHVLATSAVATVAIPSGASVSREILMVVIDVMNLEAPGAVQKIDIEIDAQKSGGSWATKWSEDDVISLPDVNGARDTLICIADVTGLLDGAATYNFRVTVQTSLAKSVQYLYSGIYHIRYKMD